ncbi:MAG: 3'(2'),5'-bisphosphate nucleotidase CysQ, partial [Gammaproteobacteria bacterium]|nr:3'(2'),5'-bisphosphate nucleotidase CysQ [Gammaproteobacteria bacterium]
MECSDLLDPVIAIAKAASKAVLEVYSEDFDVTEKKDHSPLTRADLQSHDLILKGLEGLSPHYPILSEESSEIPYEDRSKWSTYWLVDPLDGTKEFIKRNGEFTVNIALIHDHQPILGVVLAPVPDLLYYAVKGQGAYRSVGCQTPVRIRVSDLSDGPLRLIGSRSHGSEELDRFLQTVGPYLLESVGSS